MNKLRILEWICRWIAGGAFIYAAAAKITVPCELAMDVYQYQMAPAMLINLVAIILPSVELVFGLALIIALAVRSSVVQAFWVPSGSMLPTIQIGDHIFVNKLAYAVRLPLIGTELFKVGDLQRNDIVVFVKTPETITASCRKGSKADYQKTKKRE